MGISLMAIMSITKDMVTNHMAIMMITKVVLIVYVD